MADGNVTGVLGEATASAIYTDAYISSEIVAVISAATADGLAGTIGIFATVSAVTGAATASAIYADAYISSEIVAVNAAATAEALVAILSGGTSVKPWYAYAQQ